MDYCLSCFKNSSQTDEQEPLLSRHGQRHEQRARSKPGAHPVVDKIIDVLAAFNAGKLPSQSQLSRFLQNLLKSDLLKEEESKKVSNTGPTSKEGRKVLGDVRNLVQAILQFGLEKNDDDKLQDIYFQILQIKTLPVSPVYHAGETTLDAIKEGAAKIDNQVPSQDELAFDAATFCSALRTLVETSLTSSVFRLILADLFAIARDLVAHTAADVGQAALQVQQAVQGVQVREDDELIMPEIDLNETINTAKDHVYEAVAKIENAAQATKNEWKGVDDVAGKIKQKISERIKQVISRAQKDAASRSAMRAILVLVQKYADRIASGADVAASVVHDVSESFSKNDWGTSSEYPPIPYPPRSAESNVDSNALSLLQDIKEILERLGKGHALDGLLAASKKVIRDLNEVPVVLVNEINKEIEDFPEVVQPSKAKGKNKKGVPSSEKQKSSEVDYILSPAESKNSTTLSIQANPLRAYFARIGAYLDRGLDDPGWIMSKEGAETLESLFDDGVELVSVVSESVVKVGEGIISPEENKNHQREEEIRTRFKNDFKNFMKEAEAYVSAVENDKTTMQICRALDNLEDDLSGLLLQGVKKGRHGFAGLSHWIGWAIPRLMQVVPPGAIPIPSLEIKTKNIECGLYALFVQSLAGRFGNKLIPDGVVFKEWTEMRIDMAEHEPSLPGSSSKPGVQTTSRFHMHLDGVRAKVEETGYFFKYFGGLIDYEDEGLLSIDIGMSSLHKGLRMDIEVEMESNSVEFDSGVYANAPEIIIEHEPSRHRDIQEEIANSGYALRQEREIVDSPAEPLFHVVDVKVALAGVKVYIDKSRHWILNKLFLQPLGGPVIARVIRQALEDKIRVGLHDMALGLGAVAQGAKRKGEIRRAEGRLRMVQKDPTGGVEENTEGAREFLIDWWSAILQKGPMVLGYNINGDKVGDDQGKVVETRTDVTMKGIIHSSGVKTTEQPKGSPMMVYNKASMSMEIVNPTLDNTEGTDSSSQDETVVAIGGGAQLFPGKDGGDQHEGVRDSAKKAVNRIVEGLNEAGEGVERIEDRWGKRKKAEQSSTETWKSDAFDDFH